MLAKRLFAPIALGGLPARGGLCGAALARLSTVAAGAPAGSPAGAPAAPPPPAAAARQYGGLSDADRIFTNVYGDGDFRLAAARKRGDWHRTKDILWLGPDKIVDDVKASGLRGRCACVWHQVCVTAGVFARVGDAPRALARAVADA